MMMSNKKVMSRLLFSTILMLLWSHARLEELIGLSVPPPPPACEMAYLNRSLYFQEMQKKVARSFSKNFLRIFREAVDVKAVFL